MSSRHSNSSKNYRARSYERQSHRRSSLFIILLISFFKLFKTFLLHSEPGSWPSESVQGENEASLGASSFPPRPPVHYSLLSLFIVHHKFSLLTDNFLKMHRKYCREENSLMVFLKQCEKPHIKEHN